MSSKQSIFVLYLFVHSGSFEHHQALELGVQKARAGSHNQQAKQQKRKLKKRNTTNKQKKPNRTIKYQILNSLNELQNFIVSADAGLEVEVPEGDYNCLIEYVDDPFFIFSSLQSITVTFNINYVSFTVLVFILNCK